MQSTDDGVYWKKKTIGRSENMNGDGKQSGIPGAGSTPRLIGKELEKLQSSKGG